MASPPVRFFKVRTLPTFLEPNAFYYVLANEYALGYLTDSLGNVYPTSVNPLSLANDITIEVTRLLNLLQIDVNTLQGHALHFTTPRDGDVLKFSGSEIINAESEYVDGGNF